MTKRGHTTMHKKASAAGKTEKEKKRRRTEKRNFLR
jgi:hypothetical protein